MADVAPGGSQDLTEVGRGPLGRFALSQYAALAYMRARMLVNGFRSSRGVFEFSARAISYVMYSLVGLSVGIGAAAAAYSMVSRGQWNLLPVEFWVLCILWQAIAVALASFQEQFDLTGLLRFPVSFTSFFSLCLLFGLLDVTTLIGGLCCCGVLVGVTLAQPGLFGWTLLILILFGAFNMLLVRAILAWVDRWLAKRRSREIVSILFFVVLLSAQMLNPALHQGGLSDYTAPGGARIHHQWFSHLQSLEQTADKIQVWLPPGLAAKGLSEITERKIPTTLSLIALLGFWVAGTGYVLAVRLRAEYRGESLGESPRQEKEKSVEGGWRVVRGPVTAMMAKDLRTLLRSAPQLYSLAVPVLMVFLIGGLFHPHQRAAHSTQKFALPMCVAYGLLGFTQLIYNSLGPEGKGIQLLFLAPVPMKKVLLAKNLFQSLLYGAMALAAGVLACLRIGWPSAALAVSTLAWVLFALPANLAAGDVLSLTLPYRVNLGRIGRQSGSQGNALASMLIQSILLGIGAAVIEASGYFHSPWMAPLILLALALVATLVLVQILRNSDAMANRRRDLLIDKLARTE